MITIHLTTQDLVKMRFAYRPLLEIPLSYRVLINPECQSPYLRWVDEASRVLHDVDFPYLSALVPANGYIPDFLTPTPLVNSLDIEADFAEVLATSDDLIRDGIMTLIEEKGNSEMRQHFLTHPRAAVGCLVEEMRLYWKRTLSHYWSRMTSVLEGDVLYRARQLALNGPSSLFDDLHSSVGYQHNQIRLRPTCQHFHPDNEYTLNGEGIQLVPVIFRGCGRMYQITPDWQPMLAYGARGAGLWCHQSNANQSLELALGAMRAQVLQVLETPATTSELTHKLHLTAGTVSVHLSRLSKAGLAEPRRLGKCVYYHLTQRGEHLLELFGRGD